MTEKNEKPEVNPETEEGTEEAPEVIAHSADAGEEGLVAWCGANACGSNSIV